MASDHAREDDIVAKLDASDRAITRMLLTLAGAVLLLAGLYAAAFFTGNTALLQSEGVQIAVAALFALVVALVVVRFGRRFRPGVDTEAIDPRIVRRRIDAHHRYWRWSLIVALLSTTPWMASFGDNFVALARADHLVAVITAGYLILVVSLFSVLTMTGPGWFSRELHAILNDDFIRDLRARTARLGYLTLMFAVATALLATLWRPTLALPALAWTLYAGFAIPTLYYVIADWRASRDG